MSRYLKRKVTQPINFLQRMKIKTYNDGMSNKTPSFVSGTVNFGNTVGSV